MSDVTVKDFADECWSEVYNRIIGAAVFLDDASAECLHGDGGLFNLLNGGAVAVKNLSPFEVSKKEDRKAVFITQATATQLCTIHEIIRHSDFSHCILISCVSLDVVYLEINEGKDVSDVIAAGRGQAECAKQLESKLKEWIGKEQCAVEVVHIPIFAIAPTNVVFLTPPYHQVYPTFDGKLIPDSSFLDLYTLSSDERSQARRLASSLNSMMEFMKLKEDIYYMGAYSSLVAGILENSPVCSGRRKMCSNPASLIIVDRTLDLCGVTSHATESVLDKVMAVLPRFPGHSNEVAVDMSPLCETNANSHPEDIQLCPGCLLHPDDEACAQTYDYMINKSQKEVMFDLYNKLSKLDVQKSPSPKTLLKVTPQSVEKIITACKGNYDIISGHLGILQQALAVVQTLKSPKKAQLDLLTSLETQVQQSLAASRDSTSVLHQALAVVQTLKSPKKAQLDLLTSLETQVQQSLAASRDSTSVLHQISTLIRTRKDRNLSLENLLALLIHVYSLTGTEVSFHAHYEADLVEALSMALFEEPKTLWEGRVMSPEDCEQMANGVMARLKEVALMRKILVKYNSVLKPCESGVGHEYRGVLQQLVEDLVDDQRPETPDLKHRNEGIKDLLRSGLNILTSKKARSAKHPLDNPTVIIFVIGGITGEECKRLHRSIITSGVDNTLLVGSTRLVAPAEAARACLGL